MSSTSNEPNQTHRLVAEALVDLEQRGCRFSTGSDGGLQVRPAGVLTERDRAFLREHRDLLRATLTHKPAFTRFEAMVQNGLDLEGGLNRPPMAMAKWPHHGSVGICCSCGDPLGVPDACGRCDDCQRAAELFYLGLRTPRY